MLLVPLIVCILLVLLSLANIVFNVYIVALSCTQNVRQAVTATHVVLLGLGVLNLLLAVLVLAAICPAFIQVDYLSSGTGCTLVGSAWTGLHIATVWTLTALNVEKYVAISSPLHYARYVSLPRAAVVLTGIIFLAVVISLPPILHPTLQFSRRNVSCIFPESPLSLSECFYHMALALFGTILPGGLIAGANIHILIIARHHQHRIVSALWDVTLSAQATVTHQRSHFHHLSHYRGRSAAITVLQLMGTFLFLYGPPAACLLYEAVTFKPVHKNVTTAVSVILTSAPAINGFVYGIKSTVLQKNFKDIIRKKLYRNEVEYEIAARTPSMAGSRRPSVTPSLSLAIQRPLQRRMSEIIILPQHSEHKAKLIRRSSEMCFSTKGSNSSINKGIMCSNDLRTANGVHNNRKGQFYSIIHQNGNSIKSKQALTTESPKENIVPKFTKDYITNNDNYNNGRSIVICNSNIEMKYKDIEQYTEQSNNFKQGHVSRLSLRRALFAKGKKSSLDLEIGSVGAGVRGPLSELSLSSQDVDQTACNSLLRPLLLPKSQGSSEYSDPSHSVDSDENSVQGIQLDIKEENKTFFEKHHKRTLYQSNAFSKEYFRKQSLERIISEDRRDSTDIQSSAC